MLVKRNSWLSSVSLVSVCTSVSLCCCWPVVCLSYCQTSSSHRLSVCLSVRVAGRRLDRSISRVSHDSVARRSLRACNECLGQKTKHWSRVICATARVYAGNVTLLSFTFCVRSRPFNRFFATSPSDQILPVEWLFVYILRQAKTSANCRHNMRLSALSTRPCTAQP